MDTSAILNGRGLSFEVGGTTFWIRPPTPEEYDDALHLQSVVRKRLQAIPEMAGLAELPASAEGQALLAAAITETETELTATAAADPEWDLLTRRLTALRQMQENRTLADEMVEERAMLARDRWLTLRLLTGDNGKPVVPPAHLNTDTWAAVPLGVRNAARPLIWVLLRMLEELPFGWATPPALSAS